MQRAGRRRIQIEETTVRRGVRAGREIDAVVFVLIGAAIGNGDERGAKVARVGDAEIGRAGANAETRRSDADGKCYRVLHANLLPRSTSHYVKRWQFRVWSGLFFQGQPHLEPTEVDADGRCRRIGPHVVDGASVAIFDHVELQYAEFSFRIRAAHQLDRIAARGVVAPADRDLGAFA